MAALASRVAACLDGLAPGQRTRGLVSLDAATVGNLKGLVKKEREMDMDAYRILRNAEFAALDEIIRRAVLFGRAVDRCAPAAEFDTVPSIFDAVDAYYTARRARTLVEL